MNHLEKSQRNKENYKKRCHKMYLEVKTEYNLGEINDVNKRVHKIVTEASKIEGKICDAQDYIKITLADEVNDKFGITKSDFTEFVNLGYKIDNSYMKEKAIQKYNEKLKEKQFSVIIRNSFFNSHCVDNTEAAIVAPEDTDIPQVKGFTSDEFDKFLNDGIRYKREIKEILQPMYRKLSMAAEYASEWNIDKKDFKKIVDFEHYKEGGYPNENSKPKLYSIFEKFDEAGRLMTKFKFKQYEDLEKEFGINTIFGMPSRFKRDFDQTSEEE